MLPADAFITPADVSPRWPATVSACVVSSNRHQGFRVQAAPLRSIASAIPRPDRASLLKQWMLLVMLPLLLLIATAFCMLAFAAWQLGVVRPSAGFAEALWPAGLLMLAALALVVAGSWGIAMRFVRPILELTEAVERLGRGETVHLHHDQPSSALGRLRKGINEASNTLASSRNRMQSELGRTSIELAEKNLKLEAASQSRSRLLAAASHDLRQPLYALTLFSSTLRAGETDPEKITRATHIQECVASLDQLFSELLDLSRLETGAMRATPADVRLDDVFDEVSRNFRMLAESRALRLVVRKTEAWVHCDRTMLARILNNLVSNALRYTDEGGVLVGVRQQPAGTVRIDVCDTGCGIAAEHQQRIFEEFYQVPQPATPAGERKRGLGLGLATVRKLADLVGCKVSLASRPGSGTVVSLRLPACEAGALLSSERFDAPLDISGLRVLAIDDEPSILNGLRSLLLEWGCIVRTAHDIDSARAQLEDWFTPPDLVISDLHLGEGLTGPDVLRAICQRYRLDPQSPGFARLVVTGETRPERIGELTANRIPVLFKPVAPERLREAMLATVFATRGPSDDPGD